ncbi:peptidase M13 [Actinomyces johnsonii]|uniref:Peptidase M13 n=1 Tax=Actinomyces johnsonii TaxID=544581 RepID=A0A508A6T5_9ACTO|nr:M13-type metalloendopeptidase [Actinomyces johnsonii]KAA8743636.1 peptidase M13 [Actinomyces johnsonii]TQD44114.1 peptidase M13 [Actinomyces johnsonii]
MTDASPIQTGPSPSSDSSSPSTGQPDSPAGEVLAGVLETAATDSSIRPQDDLFRFVNGGWLATAEIPADRPGSGAFTVLRDEAEAACRQIVEELADSFSAASSEEASRALATNRGRVGALYAAFMDDEHLEALGAGPLAGELTPVLAAASKEELARVLGGMTPIGFMGVVGADVEVDINDPERYTSWVGQSGLGLPDESYYREEAQAPLRRAYVAHVARMLQLADLTDAFGTSAEDLAERVMAVETDLAKGHWDRVTCRDVEKMNNPMSWQEIVDSAPTLPWREWREGIRSAARSAGIEQTTFLDEAIVTQPDYLPHAARIWQETDLEDLKAWAAWHIVHGRATLLSGAFVEENFDFYGRTLQGTDELRARWKRGVALVESCLGEALGEIYVERHFPPSHKSAMEILVGRLIEAYRQSISSLEWMSPATRARALDKLALFTPKIGYPVRWRDYSAVEITPGDVLTSVRSVERADMAYSLDKLTKPVDRDEWHMTPQTVNAYYNPTMNEIVFPAAILQPPFFDPQADDAVNYAGIGAVIGHEIGHGFDDQGSTFDGTGKVSDWWTREDREAFTERTSALISQYDAYTPEVVTAKHKAVGTPEGEIPHVNGALTIGENIGDLGGLGIALKAYALALADAGIGSVDEAPVVDGLTGLQRFFYSWARIWRSKNRPDYAELLLTVDPHSPAEFRCNGIVRNVEAFYRAFEVRPDDALWLAPDERVSIW